MILKGSVSVVLTKAAIVYINKKHINFWKCDAFGADNSKQNVQQFRIKNNSLPKQVLKTAPSVPETIQRPRPGSSRGATALAATMNYLHASLLRCLLKDVWGNSGIYIVYYFNPQLNAPWKLCFHISNHGLLFFYKWNHFWDVFKAPLPSVNSCKTKTPACPPAQSSLLYLSRWSSLDGLILAGFLCGGGG